MLFNYAYKFRLYPNREQKVLLEKHFGVTRYIWNYFLNKRQEDYLRDKEAIQEKKIKNNASYYNDAKQLTKLKKDTDKEWLKEVNSQSLQSTLKYLELAYSKFLRKLAGFPKFKKKKSNQSFTIPQFLKIENNKIIFPKFRDGIKARLHREIEGRIIVSTLSKNPAGEYYISIITEREIEPMPANDNNIGIDVGIKDFAVLSTGEKIKSPRILKKYESRLAILQRRLAKKQKESKRRNIARLKVAKIHKRIANKRRDFSHKVSTRIIRENQTIVVENLNISGMLKLKKLSKSISDVSWGEFLRQLKYKALWYGRQIIEIDRWFPSSKRCSACGYILDNLKLDIRRWKCPKCNIEHDRDLNASVNILTAGMAGIARGESIRPNCV